MPRSNSAVIPISEIAARTNRSVSTIYRDIAETGEAYPGVPAKRIPGKRSIYVARAAFERAVDGPTPLNLDAVPVDWFESR